MSFETHRFRLGRFDCTLLSDGTFHYPAEGMVPGVPRQEVAKWLDTATPDTVPSPWTCMVVDTGDHKILIDTGGGPIAIDTFPGTGKLAAAVEAEGIRQDAIDTVVITHGHPDHAGGSIDGRGEPAYRNARYVMSRDEWEFWTSADTQHDLDTMGDHFHQVLASFARSCLPPIRRQLDLVGPDSEIVPGIHAISAPGHTPGHTVLRIESGGERLLYLADTAVHPLYLAKPSWQLVADVDGEAAVATRRRILDMAATESLLVLAFHFPFPGLGYVVRYEDAWRWQPLT